MRTPHVDRLASQGVRCTDFYSASPTCTVSRACLMTGRYSYRTRVVDTWIVRAMMEPEEVTLAEML